MATKKDDAKFSKYTIKSEGGKLYMIFELATGDILDVVGGFAQTGISIKGAKPTKGKPKSFNKFIEREKTERNQKEEKYEL